MMHGYLGKILVVDLSNQTITTETIDAGIYESFLSGMGLGAYYLYKAIPAHADPLGPENIIGFVSGLLTGTGSLMTGRWMVVCKSPLTGGWGDANCGGTFSIAIKRCGYDAIFVKGMSSHPVYLYADNDGAQIRNAEHVWGKDAVEAETILQKESRKNKPVSIAVIGTAGEKRSLIAGVVNDQGRIAARSGVGAVMGSKRLKAVVLNGAQRVACHDKKQVMKISKELSVKIKNSNIPKIMGAWSLPFISKLMSKMDHASALDGIFAAAVFKKWGTIYNNALGMENGDCPVKNWQGSVKDFGWRKYRKLNPGRILKRESKKYTCYSCVIACGGICNIKGIKYGTFSHTHKPEYETCNAFGALLLNDDLEAIYYINELLNRAGMDSISAGNTVAFAMECFENGVIDEKDTDGLVLRWGNAEAIIELIKKMIQREGIGDLLADGVKKAMAHFGKHSRPFGIHAGGQEPGMHDSRMDPMLGVHFSVEASPGKHTTGGALIYNVSNLWSKVSWAPKVTKMPKKEEYEVSEANALKAKANSCYKMVTDGVGGCWFAASLGIQNWPVFDWLNAATGWHRSADAYMEIGERIQTLRQMFNIKHGIHPMDFKITDRLAGHPPLENGPLAEKAFDIEGMMKMYWTVFGWDSDTGDPTHSAKRMLGGINLD